MHCKTGLAADWRQRNWTVGGGGGWGGSRKKLLVFSVKWGSEFTLSWDYTVVGGRAVLCEWARVAEAWADRHQGKQ